MRRLDRRGSGEVGQDFVSSSSQRLVSTSFIHNENKELSNTSEEEDYMAISV